MKLKLVALTMLAAFTVAKITAQPSIKKQWSTGPADYADSVRNPVRLFLTKDRGWIIGSTSFENAFCQKTENNRDNARLSADFWIVKYDSIGNIQWDKTIGGTKQDALIALQQTSDGGYILGGFSYSNASGEKTANSRGTCDYWIVKLAADGHIQWDKTIGGNSYDVLTSLQQTSDGGYILGGNSSSGISGEKTAAGTGFWVVKLNKSGSIQWNKIVPGGYEIKQTQDGGYITLNGIGLTKLDNKGNVVWTSSIAPPYVPNSYGYLAYVEQTADGGYITAGSISSENITIDEGDYYWIIKADSLGKRKWSRRFGNPEYAFHTISSIQQTKDHGYIIGAYTNSPGVESDYDWDYALLKLDKSGDMQWSETYGGIYDDKYVIAREISRDRYLVAGYSESDISGDKTVDACSDGADLWVFRLVYSQPQHIQITGSGIENKLSISKSATDQFSIYPNPASDVVHVQARGTALISIADGTGRVLLSQTITGSGTINVTKLQTGMYYIKNNNTGETRKILLTR